MHSANLRIWLGGALSTLLLASLALGGPGDSLAPIRVLFIGNSYTYMNDLPGLLEALGGDDDSAQIETKAVTGDGLTLEQHWQAGEALQAIHEGTWDFVVLQSQSTFGERHFVDGNRRIKGYATFHEYARKFGEVINARGATPVFYQQWRRREAPSEDFRVIAKAHATIAAELEAKVAPVGEVFERLRETRPALNLYYDDGSHPSPSGSFVAALTFHAVVSGGDISKRLRAEATQRELSEDDVEAIEEALRFVFDRTRG